MTDIARRELHSHRQLPQIWYQIQEKFRDEPRPKSGLLRMRQFIMKDSYSFDIDPMAMEASYKKHYDAYCRIYERCGLKYKIVEASSGTMGGKISHEFVALSDAGEDWIVTCSCGYAANQEKATSRPPSIKDEPSELSPESFSTPGQRTIEDMVKFTGETAAQFIKTLLYISENKPVLVLLPGDHKLSESKLEEVLEAKAFRPATSEEVKHHLGVPLGFVGPVKVNGVRIIADMSLQGRRNMIAGANREDTHLRCVTPGKDFKAEYHDLHEVADGDLCVLCGLPLTFAKSIEIGHVFQLGRRYSEKMGAQVLNPAGEQVSLYMGSYGIGLERILTAAIEQGIDADGTTLSANVAPFEVVLTVTNMKVAALREAGEKLYMEMRQRGIDVLYDDRDERPGVKFKDADLTGIPYRLTLGRKKFEKGLAEIMDRSTREMADVRIGRVVDEFEARRLPPE